jgi:thioredoxin reductase
MSQKTEVAIVGAGPYGLSIAANLRARGIPFRIFGRPMDSWLAHMPNGMVLKSHGCASNLFDPDGEFTLERFCAERGIGYSHHGTPITLATFTAYGVAFCERMVPELQERTVTTVDRAPGGFVVRLDREDVFARRVVIAVGLSYFRHVPEILQKLPTEFVSHSFDHRDLEPFRGRSVVVLGGGASAIDLAAGLHEVGADVHLVSRRTELRFNSVPSDRRPSLLQRVRRPDSPLGHGWAATFFARGPMLFRLLPEQIRATVSHRTLGPRGDWTVREKVIRYVPLHLGTNLDTARLQNGGIELRLKANDGELRTIMTNHVISATGYKVDVQRLMFLDNEIRSKIKVVNGSPALSSHFESSVPGLYFVGAAAALSFGPLMRFVCGTEFAARRFTAAMAQATCEEPFPLQREELNRQLPPPTETIAGTDG